MGARPTWMGWVQIAKGPIRWVAQHQEAGQPFQLYAPDRRIGPDFPDVAIRSELKGSQTFEECLLLLAGRSLAQQEEAGWVVWEHHPGINEGFSLACLSYSNTTHQGTLDLGVNRLWPGEKLGKSTGEDQDPRWGRYTHSFHTETHTIESFMDLVRNGFFFLAHHETLSPSEVQFH